MSSDLIHLACERAAEDFRHRDNGWSYTGPIPREGVFTTSAFNDALLDLAGLEGILDGHLIRVILTGRDDVTLLPDGYYRLI